MRTHRMRLVGALGVLLGAATPHALTAQATPSWLGGQPALEGYYTQVRLDAAGAPLAADGVGGRLVWGIGRPGAEPPSWLADRSSFGLFVAHLPEQQRGFSSLHLGAALDLQPLGARSGPVAPLLSLGAGALRTSVRPGAREARDASPLTAGSNTALTLSPGVGARVDLAPGLALRGDVRDLLTFRGGARHNVALEAGLRLAR
jgi:hypothetical protein